ncbi:MAG: arsenic resistance protein [Nesterenkonia sp.]
MSWAERMQSVLVGLAALLGTAIGLSAPQLGALGQHVVLPALLVMLTAIFLQLDVAAVAKVRGAKRLVAASLVLNYLVTPVLAWALGAGILGEQPDLRIGLLLLLVTPCTDWYLVFTAIARGHTGMAAALLPVNLILQVLLLPVYVLLLGGEAAAVQGQTLAHAVLLLLAVPLVAALLLRRFAPRPVAAGAQSVAGVVVPLLCIAVAAMFAWQAPVVVDHAAELLQLLGPLTIFFVVLPLTATLAAKLLRLPSAQRVTLTMTTTARNSPIALSIAAAAFPDRPLIAVALVIGPMIELPVLAVLSQLVRPRPSGGGDQQQRRASDAA